MSSNLVLHAGGFKATRDEVDAVRTPEPVGCWYPVSHSRLIDQTVGQLESVGLRVVSEAHALAKGGDRYFGLFNLEPDRIDADFNLAIGLRNSHDKSTVAGLCMGTRVFVCDNLAFTGEVRLARKHTRYIERDLPRLMADAVGKVVSNGRNMHERIECYKRRELNDTIAKALMMNCAKAQVCSYQKLEAVEREWDAPKHDDFRPRTAWSLFNAFTEVLKKYDPHRLPKRTARLYSQFDAVAV